MSARTTLSALTHSTLIAVTGGGPEANVSVNHGSTGVVEQDQNIHYDHQWQYGRDLLKVWGSGTPEQKQNYLRGFDAITGKNKGEQIIQKAKL
jgi:hypothetical protein